MLLQAVASSLCDGDGGGDDDDYGVDGDGGGEDVNGDDDDTNQWVHLCIMGMASTSDSFVFIFFGAHTHMPHNRLIIIQQQTILKTRPILFPGEHFSSREKFW